MKTTILFILILMFFSCSKEIDNNLTTPNVSVEESFTTLNIADNFNFQTVDKVEIAIDFNYNLQRIPIRIYSDSSLNDQSLLGKTTLSKGKAFMGSFALNKEIKYLYIQSDLIGIPTIYKFSVNGNSNYFTIDENSVFDNTILENSNQRALYNSSLFFPLGSFDNQGVPDYLTSYDTISQDLLDDLNASVPENKPVPIYHPEYLTDNNFDTKLIDSCDVWITFVHEGAGWRNTLGFYTYDTNNPPATTNDIDSIKILFPNLSYPGSGGNLSSGSKIKIGEFTANTSIGWVLIPNSWNGSTPILKSQMKYSNPIFNTYTSEQYRQHIVALNDETRELIVLGFEDTSRPAGDNDFNDCLFYITANPKSAIDTDGLNDLEEANDADSDGAFDHEDDYPNDPERAYNVYIQSQSEYFNYAFEDNWPEMGDYDFNDVVIGVKYKKVLNTSYMIKDIIMDMKLYTIGGYYHNGFGIEFPFNADKVESITGQVLDKGIVTVGSNGTEVGNTLASVIAFEDAYTLMSSPDELVNVKPSGNYITPHTFTIDMTLVSGQIYNSSFQNLPNPFIFINNDRGREVHLPNKTPTSLANSSYYYTGDDKTSIGEEKYYKTENNFPWGICVVAEDFNYPYEGVEITTAYNFMRNWVETDGFSYNTWYDNTNGYRNNDKIYQKP